MKRRTDFATDESRREGDYSMSVIEGKTAVILDRRFPSQQAADALQAHFKSNIALGRIGLPEEVASTPLFVASRESSYVRGIDLWGSFGQPNVAWGRSSRVSEYTHRLNWYLPAGMILSLGVITTGVELLFGLLLDWRTRVTALLSGLLVTLFGLVMTLALEVKALLNYSVSPAAGGNLLLAHGETFPFSVNPCHSAPSHAADQGRPLKRRIDFKETR
jgi:hypothetical protein